MHIFSHKSSGAYISVCGEQNAMVTDKPKHVDCLICLQKKVWKIEEKMQRKANYYNDLKERLNCLNFEKDFEGIIK